MRMYRESASHSVRRFVVFAVTPEHITFSTHMPTNMWRSWLWHAGHVCTVCDETTRARRALARSFDNWNGIETMPWYIYFFKNRSPSNYRICMLTQINATTRFQREISWKKKQQASSNSSNNHNYPFQCTVSWLTQYVKTVEWICFQFFFKKSKMEEKLKLVRLLQ